MQCTLHLLPAAILLGVISSPAQASHDHDHGPAKVRFTQNNGQWDQAVLYRSGVNGATVFLERNGSSWVKFEAGTEDRIHDAHMLSEVEQQEMIIKGHAWRMRFHGASSDLAIETRGVMQGYENFFLGNDRSKWKGYVPGFNEVIYRGVWSGVDIRYHSSEGHLKYDVLLAPGAAHAAVGFYYEGIDGARIDEQGRLVMGTSVGDIMELEPVAFYSDGAREPIACSYRLENGILRFNLPVDLDHRRPVTIDPILIAATYSGATGASNYGHCATYDQIGNIFSGARNFGPTYPATPGAFQMANGGGGTDMSFSKYNPDGSALLWASYLGGNSSDNTHSMIVNTLGELCVLGSTNSADFPVSGGAFDNSLGGNTDATVTHFSADGASLVGSTYLGGSAVDGLNSMTGNYGEAYRGEIFLDGANNILVASFTSSTDFPTTPGAFQTVNGGGQDGIVASLSPNCSSLLWSTYLGGTLDDNALGVRIAQNGAILVTGGTASTNFPVTAGTYQPTYMGGFRDGYVVRLAPGATNMIAGTFFGTSGSDRPYFIDIDIADDVWIYGQTDGNIAISPAGIFGAPGGRIFIAKLTADLTSAPITTVMGPTGTGTVPVAFLVDVCDNIYISGYNSSSGLPTTADALYTAGSFYLAAFDPDMAAMLFGTYYGGSHVDGGTSRFDKNGIVYQGVCSGGQSMQSTPWAYATTNQISWDIGVFKIDFGVAGVNAAGASAINTGCAPIEVNFSNESSGDTWLWDFGDGSPEIEAFEPSHYYTQPGDYLVRLVARDSLACNLADTTYFPITIGQQQPVAAALTWAQEEDCTEIRINANNTSTGNPLDHIWQISDGTEYFADAISHVFDVAGDYDVTLIAFDPTGCSESDTIVVPITVAPLEFNFEVVDRVLCEGMNVTLDASFFNGNYLWNNGSTSPTITVSEVGEYWVTISNPAGCIGTDTVYVADHPTYDLAVEEMTCPGVPITVTIPLGRALAYLWESGNTTRTIEVPGVNRVYDFAVIDEYGCVYQDSARVILHDADVQVFTPNAFSPNGDGINDKFEFFGFGHHMVDLTIYNRWGEQLYQTVKMDRPWDGTFNGEPVTNDVYVFVLNYTGMCTGNEEFKRIGHVTVVR